MASSFFSKVTRFLRREAWVLLLGTLAFVTRIVWNTIVHPPRNYVFSDMHGYFDRSHDFVKQPLTGTYDYLAFYPWGTHVYLGWIRRLFTTPQTCPREVKDAIAGAGCWPMDIGMALLGAIGVVYTVLIARRLTQVTSEHRNTGKRRWVYVVVGFAALLYYPFLSQGSYYLSETPFFACLAAATFHSLRLCDEGKSGDAVAFGIFVALGTSVRPQMLMSVVFLAVFWFFRRSRLPGATLKKLVLAMVPVALMLVFSAIRTTRHLRVMDKNEFALVAANDALNYAFGRCHAIGIEARTNTYRSAFGPPSLGSLHFGARDQRRKGKPVYLELDPALPDDPACEVNKRHKEKKEPTEPCLLVQGRMWSRPAFNELAKKCIQKTGWLRQGYYAFTHVVLNFGFNITWPDSGQRLRYTPVLGIPIPTGRPIMEGFQLGFGASIVPFGIVGCVLAFQKKRTREGLLAMHIWASLLVAALYFGETRLRTPYDFIFIILGFDLMGRLATWVGRKIRAKTARG
ncbi:MAG: hypothetical protein IPK82_22450 [Polyangiaceae bacterium]|nr:hypothetical protein [Polyangiaceae bacterium]